MLTHRLRRALRDATAESSAEHRRLCLADHTIDVIVHSPQLAPLLRAFDHLRIETDDGGAAEVVIEAVVADEPLPLQPPTSGGRDDRWLERNEAHTTLLAGGQLHHLDHSWWGLWWAAGELGDHPWELSRPFHLLFDWWGARAGLHLVHAGAVGTDDGALLLVGVGGSGKSTTCLSCLGTDLRYLADDYCMVSGGSDPVVHSLYATGKIDAHSRGLLGHLDLDDAPIRADGKATLDVATRWPASILPSAPLRAIVVPHVDPGARHTSVREVSRGTALRALAPSSVLQLMGGSEEKLAALVSIAAQVPAYSLSLGGDVRAVPDVLAELLSR